MYSELQQYYECFEARLAAPEGIPADRCRCRGKGWILSEVDTLHKCPDHYDGQPHPEDDEEDGDYDGPVIWDGKASGGGTFERGE